MSTMTLERVLSYLREKAKNARLIEDPFAERFDDMADAIDAAIRARAQPVGYIAESSIGALRRCRNDKYNGTADVWMRPDEPTQSVVPLYREPPAPKVTDAMVRALIETWRIRAEKNYARHERTKLHSEIDWESNGRAEALSDCADELEATLKDQP